MSHKARGPGPNSPGQSSNQVFVCGTEDCRGIKTEPRIQPSTLSPTSPSKPTTMLCGHCGLSDNCHLPTLSPTPALGQPKGQGQHLPQLREVVEGLPQSQHLPAGHKGFLWTLQHLLQFHLGEHQAMGNASHSQQVLAFLQGWGEIPICSPPPQPTEGTASATRTTHSSMPQFLPIFIPNHEISFSGCQCLP